MDRLEIGSSWTYEYPYARTETDSIGNEKLVYGSNKRGFRYYEGLAKVEFNRLIGFVDTNKIIVIPVVYEYVRGNRFYDSRAIVKQSEKYGVIDKSGNVVVPFEYDYIRSQDSIFRVKKMYDWGYIDREGEIILPLGRHPRKCQSCKITHDEILELAEAYSLKDSLEKSATISKEEAVNIAKRKGYYWEGEFPFDSNIKLDSGQWVIKGSQRCGVTYKGYCKNTNGCTVIRRYQMIIDAETGKILSKSKTKTKIANYE